MEDDPMLHVFIAHSSRDLVPARELYRQLKSEGWMDIWFIESSLRASQDWNAEIRTAVAQAEVLVLLFSRNSSRREEYIYPDTVFVTEIYLSNPRTGRLIIPLRLDRFSVTVTPDMDGVIDYYPEARRPAVDMSLMKRLRAYAGKNAFSTEKPADDPGMEQGMVWSPTRWKGRGFTADEDAFDEDARKTKPARPRSTWRGWFPDGLTHFSNFSRVILIIMLLAAAVLAMNIVIAVLNRNAIAESTLPGALSLAPLPTPTPGVGSTRVSPVDGMRLVYVPAGEFVMGGDAYFEERPVHTVILDAFWIDQTEVTNSMFASFLNAWGNREEDGAAYLDDGDIDSQIHFAEGFWRADPVYQDHPVVEVTWYGANAYCSWAGRRLPTEAEWEKAARGKAGGIYPWGNDELTTERLNFNDHVGDTAEAGSYPDGASLYGALDMAGNVWEWVADRHSRRYYSDSPLENPLGPETGFFRVLRGGGWNSRDTFVRSMHRNRGAPTISHDFVGFRCALSD